jgi:ketosteroid isomerase-like protein
MARISTVKTIALAFVLLALSLFTGNMHALAQSAEDAKVKAALEAFHAALSSLDMKKMEEVWAHDPFATLINPRDKTIAIGWDNIQKNWQNTFDFWKELKVSPSDGPHIHVSGSIAWSQAIANVTGTSKAGAAINSPTMEMDVLEKRGDRWVIVSHAAWRVPQ